MRYILFLTAALLLSGCSWLYDSLGGAYRGEPREMDANLSPGAQKLLNEAVAGIDPGSFTDFHVHMIGESVNPEWLSLWHPFKRARTMIYLSAAGVEPGETIVADHVNRLLDLIKGFPIRGRFCIYAMDRYYRPDGTVDEKRTPFYVSNEFVYDLGRRYPDIFIPVVSIHPYRLDAVERLEHWASHGCRLVKWLPNSQGIDPADDRVVPFYRKMLEHDMVLLVHTGGDQSLDAQTHHLSNPLRLRGPLDSGVKVVALHAASAGNDVDLDDPRGVKVPSFDLLLRMLDNPDYDGLLFAEISTITFYFRLDRPLRTLLEREDLHDRLINGSDYPVCAVNSLLWTSELVNDGFITASERRHLNEIYNYNPLLFDFVVKRTVRHPETGQRFPVSVFLAPPELLAPVTRPTDLPGKNSPP